MQPEIKTIYRQLLYLVASSGFDFSQIGSALAVNRERVLLEVCLDGSQQ